MRALLARSLRTLAGADGDAIATPSLEAELSRVLSEQLHAGGFDPRSLQDIILLMGRHEIPVPPTLTLLTRALVTLEGTLRVLNPRVDLATAAAAHFGASMDLSPTTAQDALQRELLRSLPSLRALPGLTEDVALQLRSGRIRLQVDAFSGPGRSYVTRWLDQVVFTAVAGVGLLASALLLGGLALARPGAGGGRAAGRRVHRPGDLVGDADAGGRPDPAPGERRTGVSAVTGPAGQRLLRPSSR